MKAHALWLKRLSEIKRIPVSMLCGVNSVASSAEVRFWEVMNMLARRLPPSDGEPFHDPDKGRVADDSGVNDDNGLSRS